MSELHGNGLLRARGVNGRLNAAHGGPPIPVTVITGFLGSGKTTLLRNLLRDPALGRSVVIINEFGEIGIDHDLIESSDENFIELTTGCLCCKVRSDLVMTLRDLAGRRARATLPPFERVLIETSGLADPAAILQALMIDRDLAGLYCLGEVVTTVDALLGASTLAEHDPSVRQVAVADRIVITKCDLAGIDLAANADPASGPILADSGKPRPDPGFSTKPGSGLGFDRGAESAPELLELLGRINPRAQVLWTVHGAISAAALLGSPADPREGRSPDRAYVQIVAEDAESHSRLHDPRIGSWCLVREAPIRAATLVLLLEGLVEHCGARLLRVKGIVNILEFAEQPAVIHGVQHVFHPPEWLPRWPSDDRRSRIVFIGEAIPSAWIVALLDVLDSDVAAEQSRRDPAPQPAPNVLISE